MKTTGSRRTGDLQPDIDLPQGINSNTLEYNEQEGWCVLECWCSDHTVMKQEHKKTNVDLEALDSQPCVIEVLKTHNKSPVVIGRILTNVEDGVDENNKELTVQGKKHKYMLKEKHVTTGGVEENRYVLDEG